MVVRGVAGHGLLKRLASSENHSENVVSMD